MAGSTVDQKLEGFQWHFAGPVFFKAWATGRNTVAVGQLAPSAMQARTFEVALQRDDLIKLSQGLSQTLRAQTGRNEAQQHSELEFGSLQRSSPKRDFKGERRCWLQMFQVS